MGFLGIEENKLKGTVESLLTELFPIYRSLTGDGNRKTLEILSEILPLEIHEIPTGQEVFDWIIPKEWNVKKAYIKNRQGEKIVDFSKNNLHLVSYSEPINKRMTFAELDLHLHTLKKYPKAIPYRTSYYKKDWGFSLQYELYEKLDRNDEYEVVVDSTLEDGSLTYADYYIEGSSKKEYMFSTYFCHPSMANDNLSGLIVQAFLASKLANSIPYHSYRFVFVPETIGAIAYCYKNQELMQNLEGGFILSNVGGPGGFSYKRSFDVDHYLNEVIEQAFKCLGIQYEIYPFDIHGSDERQYSSIGFRINMPSIHKDKYYEFDQYHTSLDNLQFVKAENLMKTLFVYEKVIEILESNRTYLSVKSECEVHLSEHGLYPEMSGHINQNAVGDQNLKDMDMMLWLLFLCDGNENLLEISQQTNFDIVELQKVAEKLKDHGIMVMKNE